MSNAPDSDRQQEIADKLREGVKGEYNQALIRRERPFWQGMPLKGSGGAILGYCTGAFAKIISKIAIFWAGVGCSFIGFLHYMKYITINYD